MATQTVTRKQGFLLAGLLALTTVFAACERTLNADSVESFIKKTLTEQTEIAFTSVECPESRPIKAGDVFQCKAVAETGESLQVDVTQKDDAGTIDWKPASGNTVLSLAAIEQNIKDSFATQMKLDASVDCGGKMRIAAKGKTFECTAKAGSESHTVLVTMDDDEGQVSWAVK